MKHTNTHRMLRTINNNNKYFRIITSQTFETARRKQLTKLNEKPMDRSQ